MFILAFVIVATAGLAYASPASPASNSTASLLNVKLTGPGETVKSVAELKFIAEVTNTGKDDVKILKYGTVLDDKLPTRVFNVMKGDKAVAFKGIEAAVSPADADDSAYTVIPAGKSVSVTHEVAALYDFQAEGTGAYTFSPNANFKVFNSNARSSDPNHLDTVQASIHTLDVSVSHDVGSRELVKRVQDFCPDGKNRTFMEASYLESKSLSYVGLSWIHAYNGSDSIYYDYFGLNPAFEVAKVMATLALEDTPEIYSDCRDIYDSCSSGIVGYWVPRFADVYYCKPFFHKSPVNALCDGASINSVPLRAGWTWNLLSRGTTGLFSITDSCNLSKVLDDEVAFYNVFNYVCFLHEVFQASICGETPEGLTSSA